MKTLLGGYPHTCDMLEDHVGYQTKGMVPKADEVNFIEGKVI